MNEKINSQIPKAILVIENFLFDKKKNVLPKEFKGYIPSMGASIIQSGLLPTLAFYQNDSGKKAKSSNLLRAILELIKPNGSEDSDLISFVIQKSKNGNINGSYISNNELDFDKLYLLEEEISDALIAIKLAFRTFKIEE